MASTLQLEFGQAMCDFKSMFPDIQRDVIEAVLRANQGAVDATIDQLLAMSIDNQNEKLRNELDDNGTNGASLRNPTQTADLLDLDNQSLIPDLLAPTGSASNFLRSEASGGASPKIKIYSRANASADSTSASGSKRWDPPILLPLPPTFLRLSSNDVRSEYDISDEQFAMMLQNEEFMNELRWNQEFMHALEKEQQEKGRNVDDLVFTERLKHMGKQSRKKFMQLAKVFTWQRNKKPGAVRHPDSLLLQEEHSDDDEPRHVPKK